MAVSVQTGANFSADTPVVLFDVGSYGRRINRYVYDVSADGQKFLVGFCCAGRRKTLRRGR